MPAASEGPTLLLMSVQGQFIWLGRIPEAAFQVEVNAEAETLTASRTTANTKRRTWRKRRLPGAVRFEVRTSEHRILPNRKRGRNRNCEWRPGKRLAQEHQPAVVGALAHLETGPVHAGRSGMAGFVVAVPRQPIEAGFAQAARERLHAAAVDAVERQLRIAALGQPERERGGFARRRSMRAAPRSPGSCRRRRAAASPRDRCRDRPPAARPVRTTPACPG